MSPRRILAVFHARNREFYRDKAGLGWNIVMPLVMVLGFAFIFSGSQEELHTVGVLATPANTERPAFLDTRHLRFVEVESMEAGIRKVGYHRLDLLFDPASLRYWVNAQSASGYLVERILLQSFSPTPTLPKRQAVTGRPIRYVDWLLPGVLAMNIMFSSLWGVGWVIVRYRKNGVLRRLGATPLRAGEFLLAQILSRLVVVSGGTLLVFLLTDLLLDFPMRGSYIALALVFLSGAVALISLGLVVAAWVRSEELADGILNLTSWPMMILSGVWFSLEGTNVWAQRGAELLPLTHMVEAARRIMLDGAGVAEVAPQAGALFGIGLVLLLFSAHSFRWQ